jgi:3',5'-cyclic AMP phosphodiesterase CpdA
MIVCLPPRATVAHEGRNHGKPVTKVTDQVAWKPTAIPERILLSWAGDPAHTQAVTWRTDTSVNHGLARIAPAGHGPRFVEKAVEVAAETVPFESDLGTAHYHTVQFDHLQPKTKYAYRVGDGTNWSEWIQFTTASDQNEPFTFVYFGDAQNLLKSHWSRVIRQAYRDAPKAAFLLHAGDLINRAEADAEWGEWFYAGSFIHRMVPCIATPGNHEYPRPSGLLRRFKSEQLAPHWRPTFAFPQNGPAGLEESVYWIDYQGTRIISLNSNERQQDQVPWLEEVLRENPNRWTILTFHHPIYSSKAGRDNPELRNLWQPIFDKYRVDLVLQGHDHTYARSKLMTHTENVATGATRQRPEAGTLYVVSVSGPKMYELGRRPFMRRAAEDTQLYQIITVDGDELRYAARTATGMLYDAFTLRKRPGKTNELTDRIPDTPELRR